MTLIEEVAWEQCKADCACCDDSVVYERMAQAAIRAVLLAQLERTKGERDKDHANYWFIRDFAKSHHIDLTEKAP